MGVKRDRGGGELGYTDVHAGVDAGSGAVHVRHRTVERHPCLVRSGPPQDIHSGQRHPLPW